MRHRMDKRLYLIVLGKVLLAVLLATSLFVQGAQWRSTPRFVPILSVLPPVGWSAIFLFAAALLAVSYFWPALARPVAAAMVGVYGAWTGGYLFLFFTLPDTPIGSTAIFLFVLTFLHFALVVQKFERVEPIELA